MDNGEFKYCVNCGAKLTKNAQFCNKCGAKQPVNGSTNFAQNNKQENQQAQFQYQNASYNKATNQGSYNGSENPGFITSSIYWLKNAFKPNQCMGRADYWWGTLGVAIAYSIISGILHSIMMGSVTDYGISGSYYFAMILYLIIVIIYSIMGIVNCVQRLHDTGHSGFNWLWCLTIIGSFYVLFLMCQPTNWNEARWPRPQSN